MRDPAQHALALAVAQEARAPPLQLPEAPERLLAADNFRILKGMLTGSSRKGTFGPADLAEMLARARHEMVDG